MFGFIVDHNIYVKGIVIEKIFRKIQYSIEYIYIHVIDFFLIEFMHHRSKNVLINNFIKKNTRLPKLTTYARV